MRLKAVMTATCETAAEIGALNRAAFLVSLVLDNGILPTE